MFHILEFIVSLVWKTHPLFWSSLKLWLLSLCCSPRLGTRRGDRHSIFEMSSLFFFSNPWSFFLRLSLINCSSRRDRSTALMLKSNVLSLLTLFFIVIFSFLISVSILSIFFTWLTATSLSLCKSAISVLIAAARRSCNSLILSRIFPSMARTVSEEGGGLLTSSVSESCAIVLNLKYGWGSWQSCAGHSYKHALYSRSSLSSQWSN